MSRTEEHFPCPHCGADVPLRARACPECGSDAETGWSEDADKWTAGIPAGYGPDDDFDYDDFVRREFGGEPHRRYSAWSWIAVVALALTALWVLLQILQAWFGSQGGPT